MTESKSYQTFRELYPFYLREHRNPASRRLHFIGTSLGLLLLVRPSRAPELMTPEIARVRRRQCSGLTAVLALES